MQKLWELKSGDKIKLSKKSFKVERVESFRLMKAKDDSARWVFLKNGKKDYVIYLVKKNGRINPSLEEGTIDKSKRQWWRNYEAVKMLKL